MKIQDKNSYLQAIKIKEKISKKYKEIQILKEKLRTILINNKIIQ